MNEILKCDHSSESYLAVLLCGTVYCVVQCGSKLLGQTSFVWVRSRRTRWFYPKVLWVESVQRTSL